MATDVIELDFELCRQMLFRLDEILLGGGLSMPRDYEFDGHSPEMISYNAQVLGDAKLVRLKTAMNWTRGQLRYWPVWFFPPGEKFLAAAKDENRWAEAVKTVKAQDSTHNLKALKAVLLANVWADV